MSFAGKREYKSNLDTTSPSTGRGLNNQYVTTSHRNTNAIRVEIVEAAYTFLAERLDSRTRCCTDEYESTPFSANHARIY
jgi:hypothetical protein